MHLKISDMDMLHGSLAGKLLLFTLPIALSSMVQQLFNAADTAVAGHFGSANALAAVGTNTQIIALIVMVSSGLSIGANVLIAKHVGRNEAEKLPAAVQTAMRLAMCIGVIGLLLGQIAAAPLLRLIRTPEEIFDAAALYLRIYMLGYPLLLLYDFGAACLRARGDSRYPFLALLLSRVCKCGAQPAVHGRASHGRCRRCDCDGSFHHALGVSGAASSGKGCSVSLCYPQSEERAQWRVEHSENRHSVGCAGCGVLLCKHFCVGVG